jgi:hypothetical protein
MKGVFQMNQKTIERSKPLVDWDKLAAKVNENGRVIIVKQCEFECGKRKLDDCLNCKGPSTTDWYGPFFLKNKEERKGESRHLRMRWVTA